MDHSAIISELARNRLVFEKLLSKKPKATYLWKPSKEQWCVLEIVCHLLDEEREDFKSRIRHLFEHPNTPPPAFDQVAWVTERKYVEQNYEEKLYEFLDERDKSIIWLQSLENPAWMNAYKHPKLGKVTAECFLANWLAHDYLHIRQVDRINYRHLQESSQHPLDYAGKW